MDVKCIITDDGSAAPTRQAFKPEPTRTLGAGTLVLTTAGSHFTPRCQVQYLPHSPRRFPVALDYLAKADEARLGPMPPPGFSSRHRRSGVDHD